MDSGERSIKILRNPEPYRETYSLYMEMQLVFIPEDLNHIFLQVPNSVFRWGPTSTSALAQSRALATLKAALEESNDDNPRLCFIILYNNKLRNVCMVEAIQKLRSFQHLVEVVEVDQQNLLLKGTKYVVGHGPMDVPPLHFSYSLINKMSYLFSIVGKGYMEVLNEMLFPSLLSLISSRGQYHLHTIFVLPFFSLDAIFGLPKVYTRY